MDDFERYCFDLQGFLIVENAFSLGEVDELNKLLDGYDLWTADHSTDKYHEMWQYDENFKIVGPAHRWDEPFRRAIAKPGVAAYLTELLGADYRYDHGHVLLMRNGGGRLRLHGGGTPYSSHGAYHFRDNKMWNGEIAVSLALVDMSADEGGFVCLPGSHKANLACPETFLNLETMGRWVQRTSIKAGSIVIFTESLTHGTFPWTGDHERRTLLMKYMPGNMASQNSYPVPDQVSPEDLTERMRSIFRPPFETVHDPRTHKDTTRVRLIGQK